jgi:hypothetical protein
LSVGFLSSEGTAFDDDLLRQRYDTNAAIAAFDLAGLAVATRTQDPDLQAQMKLVNALLRPLDDMRRRVDAGDISALQVLARVTRLNAEVIDLLAVVGRTIFHAPTARAVQRHAFVLRARDLAGLERAHGMLGLAAVVKGARQFPEAVNRALGSDTADQDLLFRTYGQLAAQLADLFVSPQIRAVHTHRQVFRSGADAQLRAVTMLHWVDMISAELEALSFGCRPV